MLHLGVQGIDTSHIQKVSTSDSATVANKRMFAAVASIKRKPNEHLQPNVTYSRYTQSLHAAIVFAMAKKHKADIRHRFGNAVRQRRDELRLTQEDLADQAGIHRTYLSDIERGARNPSLINIDRLAAALSLTLPELFALTVRQ